MNHHTIGGILGALVFIAALLVILAAVSALIGLSKLPKE